MLIADYSAEPAELATALVNSYGLPTGIESLESAEDVQRLIVEHAGGWSTAAPETDGVDLDAVRKLRSRLRAVFDAPDPAGAAAEINRILADHGAAPSLSLDGPMPHLHFEDPKGDLVDWLAVVTAMGLAAVMVEDGPDRLGVCQADGCEDVFVDTSRNRSRRHCSDGCRNRQNVAAHRRRIRAQ